MGSDRDQGDGEKRAAGKTFHGVFLFVWTLRNLYVFLVFEGTINKNATPVVLMRVSATVARGAGQFDVPPAGGRAIR